MLSRPGRVNEGYRKGAASRNRRARAHLAFLSLALALLASGCSLTMHLPGFSSEEEVSATHSIAPAAPAFPVPLDDEDWRRVNAALALAVDPQGAGLPVNWDNPASKRRGTIEPSGSLAVVGHTVCRPFKAKVIDGSKPKLAPVETLHTGQACRTGPGEWAMRDVKTGNATAQARAEEQKLPPAAPAMLQTGPGRF